MLPVAPMEPISEERVICSIMASVKYEVPANIMLAIAEKEGGKPGSWVKNSNGTFDVGSMQFNTVYLKDLVKYGITAEAVASPGCYPFDLAAWRVRNHLLHDEDDIWTRAANYHSRTPKYNSIYRADLIKKAGRWQEWLATHFEIIPVTEPKAVSARIRTIKVPVQQNNVPIHHQPLPQVLTAEQALEHMFGKPRNQV